VQIRCKIGASYEKLNLKILFNLTYTYTTSRIESPPKQMTEAVIVDAQYSSLSRNCIGRCIRTRSRSQNLLLLL
jgi:hypothetical protein